MFKKFRKNEKGFTLAELLIVVAIIGVLVAISIPIFTSQLEKSRDAVSVANMRAAYAEAMTAYLTGTGDGNVTVTKGTDGKISTIEVKNVVIKSQKADNWNGLAAELPWCGTTVSPADTGANTKGTLTFTYNGDGEITLAAFA